MSSAQNNTFYTVVVTNRQTDKPLAYYTYGRKQHASSRRTSERNHSGNIYDAKVFECTYGLGVLLTTELDYTEYDQKRARKLARR